MNYSPFRHIGSVLSKRKVVQLTFFITARCNLRCRFCFYTGERERPREDLGELTLSEIEKISLSMGNLLWLAFSGGEIFLRDDIVEISRIFYRNNKPSIMLFPTNGMMPDTIREGIGQILSCCKKSIIAVKLSVDGLGRTHDTLRNKSGSFDSVMKTYGLLEDLAAKYPNFELGINTVFCSGNQDEMDEIIDFVGRMKNIKTHTISLVRGKVADESYKEIDNRKYLAAIGRLELNLKKKSSTTYRFRGARIKAAQDILQRRLIHRTTVHNRASIPCYAGRLNLVLTETGNVYPCELLEGPLGNVREADYDMENVINSQRARSIIRSIREEKCFCTHECYLMTNILFNPRMYPALAREYMQVRFKGLRTGD